jgi:ubiquinone/menaquinone biosynthesis C-methylase UbiE
LDTHVLRDPESAEFKHLAAACQLSGKKVAEIGCGAGFLTLQYAVLPHQILAIDPDGSTIRIAKNEVPDPSGKLSFLKAEAEALPFRSSSFDVVLFSSSF